MKKLLILSMVTLSLFAKVNVSEININDNVPGEVLKKWSLFNEDGRVSYTLNDKLSTSVINLKNNNIMSIMQNRELDKITKKDTLFFDKNKVLEHAQNIKITISIKTGNENENYDLPRENLLDVKTINDLNNLLLSKYEELKEKVMTDDSIKFIKINASVENKDTIDIITNQLIEMLIEKEADKINLNYINKRI